MYEIEYFKYIDENKFTNPYIQRNLKHFLINETFRVGFSTYVKPPTNPFTDGFKYSTYPKKMKFFNDCVRNITNPKRNSYFRINPIESANSNHPILLVWDYCSTNKI